jgi:hypothetical protein
MQLQKQRQQQRQRRVRLLQQLVGCLVLRLWRSGSWMVGQQRLLQLRI